MLVQVKGLDLSAMVDHRKKERRGREDMRKKKRSRARKSTKIN